MATSVLDATTNPQKCQVVDLRTAAGGHEYTDVLLIIENSVNPFTLAPNPQDISTDAVRLSLGTDDAPGPWRTPDVDITGQDANGAAAAVMNARAVQLMIGVAYTPADGTYRLWSQVGDAPESVVRSHFRVIVRGNS